MSLLKALSTAVPAETPRQSAIRLRAGLQPVAGNAATPLPGQFLTLSIEAQDMRPSDSRIGVRTGYIHVSTLVNACARREVIANLHTSDYVNKVTPADRVVWALGRAAERHVRKQFLAACSNQGVYGKWACVCEHHTHVGMVPEQSPCERCGTPRNRFIEHPIYDEDAWIVGNCDLPVMHGQFLVVNEVKSIKRDGPDGFEGLEDAKAQHKLQALIYRDLYRRAGWKVHNFVNVLYVCKDYPKKGIRSIYKEFQVDGTDNASQVMVETARAEARLIRDGIVSKQIPPRTMCQTTNSPAARNCPMMSLCWNL